MFYTLFVLMMLFHSTQGHAVLSSPKPRTGMSVGNGEKFPGNPTAADLNSCKANGKETIPGPIAETYAPGAEATVTWDLKIKNASASGVRIAIRYPGEKEFKVLAEKLDVEDLKANVTLPEKPCDNCVLQWMWHCTHDGGFYVGCSDIAIKAPAAEDPEDDAQNPPAKEEDDKTPPAEEEEDDSTPPAEEEEDDSTPPAEENEDGDKDPHANTGAPTPASGSGSNATEPAVPDANDGENDENDEKDPNGNDEGEKGEGEKDEGEKDPYPNNDGDNDEGESDKDQTENCIRRS